MVGPDDTSEDPDIPTPADLGAKPRRVSVACRCPRLLWELVMGRPWPESAVRNRNGR